MGGSNFKEYINWMMCDCFDCLSVAIFHHPCFINSLFSPDKMLPITMNSLLRRHLHEVLDL